MTIKEIASQMNERKWPIIETQSSILKYPGEGRTIAVVGDVYRFLATGEETNGQYALLEAIGPPGGGPPDRKNLARCGQVASFGS